LSVSPRQQTNEDAMVLLEALPAGTRSTVVALYALCAQFFAYAG